MSLSFDFRLHVFYLVAKHLSFTKAAQELFITQPAVTKHIKELEIQLALALFERRNNQVTLTRAGQVLFTHVEAIRQNYRQLELDLSSLTQQVKPELRLGASSTLAQYVIPGILARFASQFPGIALSLLSGNTQQVEQALLEGQIDLGLVEGRSHRSDLRYTSFQKDELVLVGRADHPLAHRDEISLEELVRLDFISRERGSGSREVIEHALQQAGIGLAQVNILLEIASTEGIKSYLKHSSCMAFLSLVALEEELRSGALCVVDVAQLSIERDFYAVQAQGVHHKLAEQFLRFAAHNPQ